MSIDEYNTIKKLTLRTIQTAPETHSIVQEYALNHCKSGFQRYLLRLLISN